MDENQFLTLDSELKNYDMDFLERKDIKEIIQKIEQEKNKIVECNNKSIEIAKNQKKSKQRILSIGKLASLMIFIIIPILNGSIEAISFSIPIAGLIYGESLIYANSYKVQYEPYTEDFLSIDPIEYSMNIKRYLKDIHYKYSLYQSNNLKKDNIQKQELLSQRKILTEMKNTQSSSEGINQKNKVIILK